MINIGKESIEATKILDITGSSSLKKDSFAKYEIKKILDSSWSIYKTEVEKITLKK